MTNPSSLKFLFSSTIVQVRLYILGGVTRFFRSFSFSSCFIYENGR